MGRQFRLSGLGAAWECLGVWASRIVSPLLCQNRTLLALGRPETHLRFFGLCLQTGIRG